MTRRLYQPQHPLHPSPRPARRGRPRASGVRAPEMAGHVQKMLAHAPRWLPRSPRSLWFSRLTKDWEDIGILRYENAITGTSLSLLLLNATSTHGATHPLRGDTSVNKIETTMFV